MIRAVRLLALLPFLFVLGCDSADSFDVSAYVGTYTGTRDVIDDGRTDTESVTVVISADESAGTAALTLTPQGGAPERLPGTFDENGFRFALSQAGISFSFTASPEGAVTGTSDVFGQDGTISGQITPSRVDLTFAPLAPGGTRTEIRTSR